MTITYADKAHVDEGLEWGGMWYLRIGSAEMNVSYGEARYGPPPAQPGTVRRVMVARRRWRGSRERGYAYRYFVRLPGREYKPTEYMTVIEGDESSGPYRSLFLTEVQAWEAYADWLQRRTDHYRRLLETGQQMLAETEAIVRMKRSQL